MIKAFLYLFYQATLETQGDFATINHVLFTIDILVQYFEKSLVRRLSNSTRSGLANIIL